MSANMLDSIYDYMHKSKKRAKKKKSRKASLGLRLLRAAGTAPSVVQISHMAKYGLVPYYARGQVAWDAPYGKTTSTKRILKAMALMPKSKKRAKRRISRVTKLAKSSGIKLRKLHA